MNPLNVIEIRDIQENKMAIPLSQSLQNITGMTKDYLGSLCFSIKSLIRFMELVCLRLVSTILFVRKYDGQTLFLSAVGSSFPLSLNSAGITIGTLAITKTSNADGSVSYFDEPRGTIKSFDDNF